jgi:preprotein translocase subunit SecG
MFVFFTIIHVLLSIFMIFVILLQPGKDAGMGAALGGGAATSAFGGRGAATFLTKLTAFCAVAFFLTSLGLSFVGLRTSVADSIADQAAKSATTTPTTTTPAPTTNEVTPASPTEATPKPAAAEPAPSPADAVPAQKLPAN